MKSYPVLLTFSFMLWLGGLSHGQLPGYSPMRRNAAPQVGDAAPKVKAKSVVDGKEVDLATPKRLTVLIFGSHT